MGTKLIKGIYKIYDCENNGDIISAKNELIKADKNIHIVNTYWDRMDCGNAYIEFTIPENKALEVHNKLDVHFTDMKIENFIELKIPLYMKNLKLYSIKEYRQKIDDLSTLIDDRYVYLNLFFNKTDAIRGDEVIAKAAETLNNSAHIQGCAISINDRDIYIHVLFKAKIKDVNIDKLKAFGNLCIGCHGWLHDNHIYGEMSLVSILKERYLTMAQDISQHKPITYKACSYYIAPKEFQYEEYMRDDKHIKDIIEHNNESYTIYR